MITLQERFTSGVGGFVPPLNYIQLTRNDKVAVYQRSHSDGTIKDFETFLIKILPKGTQVFQTTTEDDEEKYAATSSFGRIAWSFHGPFGKSAAINKFNDLNKDQSVKDEIIPTEIEADEIVTVKTGKRGRQPKERFELTIPVGKFTTKELSELNKVEYQDAVFFINEVLDKKIRFIGEERRNVKGKPSRIYQSI